MVDCSIISPPFFWEWRKDNSINWIPSTPRGYESAVCFSKPHKTHLKCMRPMSFYLWISQRNISEDGIGGYPGPGTPHWSLEISELGDTGLLGLKDTLVPSFQPLVEMPGLRHSFTPLLICFLTCQNIVRCAQRYILKGLLEIRKRGCFLQKQRHPSPWLCLVLQLL